MNVTDTIQHTLRGIEGHSADITARYAEIAQIKETRQELVTDLITMASEGDLTVSQVMDITGHLLSIRTAGAREIWAAAKAEPNAITPREIWLEKERRRLAMAQVTVTEWQNPLIDLADGQHVVYFLFHGESGGPAYIGRTKSLLTRLIAHSREKAGLWEHWAAFEYPDERSAKINEAGAIRHYAPPLNKRQERADLILVAETAS